MAQPVVYLDTSMLLNFSMDFIILAVTARLSGFSTRLARLAAGSALGSLYILVIFLPEISFLYNMSVKFVYSCLIVLVTFYPINPRKFFVALGYFYGISFALGGAIYGFAALSTSLTGKGEYEVLVNLISQASSYFNVLVWGFPLALLFWAVLGRWGWSALKRTLTQAFFKYPVCIGFGDVIVELTGLVDTGNHLRDPITKKPVVVVEANLLLPHLPEEVIGYIDSQDFTSLETSLQGTHWSGRLCLIPFSSVGRQNGLMIGFTADKLKIKTPVGEAERERTVIGLYTKALSPDGAYRALIHPDLLPVAG